MEKPNKKYKVLVISDHALSHSGVGVQTRHLLEGLLKKDTWTFRQLGAAKKHVDYRTHILSEDFIIKPIDGFGDVQTMRMLIASEKPDLLFIFTDPRFFFHIFSIEDEIHQVCPIIWWHVWDNDPKPRFNKPIYESVDTLNCHSHKTYTQLIEDFPEKTNFIPHTLPPWIFNKLSDEEIAEHKKSIFGNQHDHRVCLWINRNAKRKRSNDVLWSWKKFVDNYVEEHGTKPKALLLMHTDPVDEEGPNLYTVAEMLGIREYVRFSKDNLEFSQINVLHNVSDFCLNISFAEGFGLSTLESMQCGNPIIAVKTGGLTRQVVDHRDGTENGIALDVDFRTMVGSQQVPYIYEDYASTDNIAAAIKKMVEMPEEELASLGAKAMSYVESEFNHQKMIDDWHDTMLDTIHNWRDRYQRVTLKEVS